MLSVISFLRDGGTVQGLEDKYAIAARRHPQFPNLLLLKYSQIESPFAEKLVQECRGIILDEAADYSVVSLTFKKFFNHGEGHAAPIDWESARVQEKADGSLCQLYHYNGEWHIATSGSPDAGGQVGDFPFTFKELFWRAMKENNFSLPNENETELCFAFELTSKYNRIVVIHDEPKLVLLAVRNRKTLQEIDPREFADRYPVIKHYDLNSFESITESFRHIDPMRQEGYVVVDGNFNRVKLKAPQYVAIHHLKEGTSTSRFVEIIRSGEQTEFLSYFPEWTEEFTDIQNRFDGLVSHIESEYLRLKDIPVQKDFALEAVKTRCPSALFSIRAKKSADARQHLSQMNLDTLVSVLGLKTKAVAQDT